MQRRRMARAHWISIGCASGPDSPPTITQCIPSTLILYIGPINGSKDRNLIVEGINLRSSILPRSFQSIFIMSITHSLKSFRHHICIQLLQPGDIFVQPVTGFQVDSAHSIFADRFTSPHMLILSYTISFTKANNCSFIGEGMLLKHHQPYF
jgi:hypothetical protein